MSKKIKYSEQAAKEFVAKVTEYVKFAVAAQNNIYAAIEEKDLTKAKSLQKSIYETQIAFRRYFDSIDARDFRKKVSNFSQGISYIQSAQSAIINLMNADLEYEINNQ